MRSVLCQALVFGIGAFVGILSIDATHAADPPFIDTHFHAHPHLQKRGSDSFDTATAARNALKVLNEGEIRLITAVPPPRLSAGGEA